MKIIDGPADTPGSVHVDGHLSRQLITQLL